MFYLIRNAILGFRVKYLERKVQRARAEQKVLRDCIAQIDFWTAEEIRLWKEALAKYQEKEFAEARRLLLQSRTAQTRGMQEIRKVKKPRKETIKASQDLDKERERILALIDRKIK